MTVAERVAPAVLLKPDPDPSPQWLAESMQLVNWGGFEGHHTIVLADSATLLSGASGTGKSTLLDAYIALMMDSNTPFNGASNDNVTGRARSGEQRSILSYMRGKNRRQPRTGTRTAARRCDARPQFRHVVSRGDDLANRYR